MKYKKFFLIIFIVICLFSIVNVSASDANDTIMASDYNSIENEEVISLDLPILGATNDGSFSDLANEIAQSKGELNLTKNYKYTSSDSVYKNGILISKSIVINGNGFTLNGKKQARIFEITNSNVVLNNICFMGAYSHVYAHAGGAAIYWSGVNGTLNNCSFEDSDVNYGGAVYWSGANGTLSNCNFVKSYATDDYCGAVYWSGANGTLSNCSFVDSYSFGDYGAVTWRGSYGTLSDCSFVDSTLFSGGCGAAVNWRGSYGTLSDCNFVNSTVYDGFGGAVAWYGDNGAVIDCSFINSSITTNNGIGGGIYFNGKNCSLLNSTFKNNFAANSTNFYSTYPLETDYKMDTAIIANDSSIYYDGPSNVYLKLIDENSNILVGEQVRIFFNNEYYYRTTNADGIINILNQTKLLPNNYRTIVYYDGSGKYKSSNISFVMTVLKAVTHFDGNDVVVSDANDAVATVTLKDTNDNIISGVKVRITVGSLSKTNVTDKNGQFSLNFSSLGSGEYTITAKSASTNLYEEANISLRGYIDYVRTDVTLWVPDVKIKYGDSGIAVATLKDENGSILSGINVKLSVGNLVKTAKTDANGQVSLDFSSLGPGQYYIIAQSGKTNEYNPTSTTAVVIITSNTTLTFSSTEIRYGTANSIFATLKDESDSPVFNVNVKLVVGNLSIVTKTNQKGQVSLDISSLKPGEYSLSARSAITNVYNVSKANAKLTIISDTTLTIPKVNVKYGDKGVVVATLKDGKGDIFKGVKVKLVVGNLTKISRTDENGQVSLDISSLGPGDYKIGARSAKLDFYNEVKAYSTASIYENRVTPTLTIPNVAIDYGTGVAVATLKDADGNVVSGVKVKLVVGNLTKIARTDKNGQISLEFSDFKPGVYRIAARSASTCIYNEVKAYAKATVSINTTLIIPDITTRYGSFHRVVATLKDLNGNVVPDVRVKLSVGGLSHTEKTDVNGQISWVMSGLKDGLYNLSAKSASTNIYHAAKAYAKVVVTIPSMLSVKSVNVTHGSGVVVATLITVNGFEIKNADVELSVGNLTKIAKTDNFGKVSLDISSLKPGEYQIVAKFAGNELYLPTENYARAVVN